ncbi:hypothetical protein QBC47DRAFT_311685, partial [Echria macrotheca]
VFIIIDALDECDDSNRQRSRFVKEMLDYQAACEVNFLVTSRPIPNVTAQFERFPWVEVCAQRSDLQKYVEARLKDLRPVVRNNIQLHEEIRTTISGAADGL